MLCGKIIREKMDNLSGQQIEITSNESFIGSNKKKANSDYSLLIVDDKPKNIQVLGGILRREGYDLSFALNGYEALDLIKDNNFDLILLDVMMPEIDGFSVCRKLKNDPLTQDIPVIFITARAENHHVLRGFEVGGQDYIAKPFNSSELIARVDTHLKLRERSNELNELNKNLEKEVNLRTCELKTANKKLAQLDQAKNEFLRQISHELKNPLQTIMLVSDYLKESALEEQQPMINYLKESICKLEKLSNSSLLITKLLTNNYPLDLYEVSLNDLVDEVLLNNAEAIGSKGLQVAQNKEIHRNVNIHEEYIKASLSHLLDNAIKYSPVGGTIYIDAFKEGDFINIAVSDQGCGFNDFAINNFKKPFNLDDSINKNGMGNSLYIVHLIMQAHKGQLTLDQSNGKTKLQMSFPIR